MESVFFRLKYFLKYKCSSVNAHGLHSPFLFEFYNQVIADKENQHRTKISEIRKYVFGNNEVVDFIDPKTKVPNPINVGKWAKKVTSSKKFAAFLIRLIDFLTIETVLETGTATGINTACLSQSTAKQVVSLEGSEDIFSIAERTINQFDCKNVKLVLGNVKDIFEPALDQYLPELIFLDADHRSATISFYLSAIDKMKTPPKCILIHDIYWSRDMHGAWDNIVKDKKYKLTIDLFECGIIFPDFPGEKQHYSLQF